MYKVHIAYTVYSVNTVYVYKDNYIQHGKKYPSTKSFEYKIFKGKPKYLIYSFVERPGLFKNCGSTTFQKVKAGLSQSWI